MRDYLKCRMWTELLVVVVLAATPSSCGGSDTDSGPDASAAEAGADDGGGGGPSDAAGPSADLAALGACSSWSQWKPTNSAGYACEHKCDKYAVQCTRGANKGGTCACTDMVLGSGTGWGGGSYRICKQPSTGDPGDCKRSFLQGCCVPLVK